MRNARLALFGYQSSHHGGVGGASAPELQRGDRRHRPSAHVLIRHRKPVEVLHQLGVQRRGHLRGPNLKYGTPVSGWQQQLVSRSGIPGHAPSRAKRPRWRSPRRRSSGRSGRPRPPFGGGWHGGERGQTGRGAAWPEGREEAARRSFNACTECGWEQHGGFGCGRLCFYGWEGVVKYTRYRTVQLRVWTRSRPAAHGVRVKFRGVDDVPTRLQRRPVPANPRCVTPGESDKQHADEKTASGC